MARPSKLRCICSVPEITEFLPAGRTTGVPVVLGLDEYECMRLLDYEGCSQAACAEKMQVGRTTVTRMYNQARKKLITALAEARPIALRGGDVFLCPALRPECVGNPHCCHLQSKKIVESEETDE